MKNLISFLFIFFSLNASSSECISVIFHTASAMRYVYTPKKSQRDLFYSKKQVMNLVKTFEDYNDIRDVLIEQHESELKKFYNQHSKRTLWEKEFYFDVDIKNSSSIFLYEFLIQNPQHEIDITEVEDLFFFKKRDNDFSFNKKRNLQFSKWEKLKNKSNKWFRDYFSYWFKINKSLIPWEEIEKIKEGMTHTEIFLALNSVIRNNVICSDGSFKEDIDDLAKYIVKEHFTQLSLNLKKKRKSTTKDQI